MLSDGVVETHVMRHMGKNHISFGGVVLSIDTFLIDFLKFLPPKRSSSYVRFYGFVDLETD